MKGCKIVLFLAADKRVELIRSDGSQGLGLHVLGSHPTSVTKVIPGLFEPLRFTAALPLYISLLCVTQKALPTWLVSK